MYVSHQYESNVFHVACFALLLSACVSHTETQVDGEASVTSNESSASTADPGPTAVESTGALAGTLTLSGTSGTAEFSNMCPIPGRDFVPRDEPGLADTTAFAVYTVDGVEVERLPIVASQLDGGSMVIGPVVGFFDDDPPPGSSDSVYLPYIDAELVVEIEGIVVSQPVSVSDFSTDDCIGTTEPG